MEGGGRCPDRAEPGHRQPATEGQGLVAGRGIHGGRRLSLYGIGLGRACGH